MSRTPALSLGAAALVAAAALVPSAAQAATPGAAVPSAWSSDAPFIDQLDGNRVSNDEAGTLDRTPRIRVASALEAHLGSTLVVRDSTTKAQLCTGDFPVRLIGSSLYGSYCSLSVLPIGTTSVEAVYVDAEGSVETDATPSFQIHEVPQHVELDVVGYDSDDDSVSLRGTGFPGASIEVGQGLEGETFSGAHKAVDVSDEGTWETTFDAPADGGFDVFQDKGLVLSAHAEFTRDAPLAPSAFVTDHGSQVVVDVTATEGSRIVIRDRSGRDVASAPRTGSSTILSFRAPTAEADFFVHAVSTTVEGGDVLSPAEVFTVKKGIGTRIEAAPVVDDVTRSGDRVTAGVAAEPGALVTVKDESGAVVASRMAGATGTLQLSMTIPATVKAGDAFFVEQSKNGQTSDRDDLEIPAV